MCTNSGTILLLPFGLNVQDITIRLYRSDVSKYATPFTRSVIVIVIVIVMVMVMVIVIVIVTVSSNLSLSLSNQREHIPQPHFRLVSL